MDLYIWLDLRQSGNSIHIILFKTSNESEGDGANTAPIAATAEVKQSKLSLKALFKALNWC